MKTYNMNEIQAGLEKKLNQKELTLFKSVLADLKRAEKYIIHPETVIAKTNKHPYGTSFVNKQGEALDAMNKHIGSDICYLYNSIRTLDKMLNKSE